MANIVLMKYKPSHITWEHRSNKIQTLTYNMVNIVLNKMQTLTYNMGNIVLIKYKPSHITWRISFLLNTNPHI